MDNQLPRGIIWSAVPLPSYILYSSCSWAVVGLWQGSGCWLVWLGWAGDEALAFPKEKGLGRSSSDAALANPKEKGEGKQ